MDERKRFADQIWFTRISRTKAENRLIDKENFIQFINIYYSLFSIICSIISFAYGDQKMSLFTIIMTIALMISILYLNGQKYTERARDYRANYTQLQRLEMELCNPNSKEPLERIQDKYCELLKGSSNHIEYDYLLALENSSIEHKMKRDWDHNKIKLRLGRFWRWCIKALVLLVPIIILAACEVWAK